MEIGDPRANGFSGERLARIRPWMRSYVQSQKLPGMLAFVARRGTPVYFDVTGMRDVERGLSLELDSLFRIYSMTKPITSVAMMMLYENGRFQLDDPVARYIPGFSQLQVFASGTAQSYSTTPCERHMTIRDLLTHTSGLTYDFIEGTVVGQLYRKNRLYHVSGRDTMAEFIDKLATLPLLAQPGEQWNYSVSTDVLGYLVELLSEQSFPEFVAEHITGPLGMVDTAFQVPPEKVDRFAACYTPAGPDGGLKLTDDPTSSRFLSEPVFPSGGGGLISTAEDYFRFSQMLLNKGELGGVRLLGRKTVEYMMSNHLDGDMAAMGQPRFSETSYEGIGFGLGGSVVVDAQKSQTLQSNGTFSWGGMASTGFWIDPEEEIVAVLMTQLQPSSTYPIRNEFRVLVNQALVD